MNNYPDGLSDTSPGAPWNAKEGIDLELVEEALYTAEHLEELLSNEDFQPIHFSRDKIAAIVWDLRSFKLDNDGGPS